MNSIIGLTPKVLRAAADLQERIQSLQNELNQLLGGAAPAPAQPAEEPKKKGTMSAAGRAAIRAAQKARWAKVRGAAPAASDALAPKKKKRRLSAQGIANIRAGVEKRMAKQAAMAKK